MAGRKMHVAVQGCSHGCLTEIYDTIAQAEEKKGCKVDVLLCCGDFQALRNTHDFASLAVPAKYRELGTFHEYYSGAKVAPVLTIVIGGNHECSAYMWELYHGGWLAPNIYYLGAAGSIMVGGVRISGSSGIYKSHDFTTGHHERVPYDPKTVKSAYHTRGYDVQRLKLLTPRQTEDSNDIFLSHDWPVTITKYGNEAQLLRKKPFFAEECRTDTLGSPPMLEVLHLLKPKYWFSAHLHVKFAAYVRHQSDALAVPTANDDRIQHASAGNPDEIDLDDVAEDEETAPQNPDEIDLDLDEDEDPAPQPDEIELDPKDESVDVVEKERATGARGQSSDSAIAADPATVAAAVEEVAHTAASDSPLTTRFLALDKCLPQRHFLQILTVPSDLTSEEAPEIKMDVEWLAITKVTHPYLPLQKYGNPPLPPAHQLRDDIARTASEIRAALDARLGEQGVDPYDVASVQQFWPTAPTVTDGGGGPDAWYTNPQTEALCHFLGIPNIINPAPLA